MDPQCFDRLARMMARCGSRRQVLAGLLAGGLAGMRLRPTRADDDSGTAIADASGGDHNTATVLDPVPRRNDPDNDQTSDGKQDQDKRKDRDKDDDEKDRDRSKDKECPATCPLCEECDTATGQCVAVTCPSPTVCCPSGVTAGQCLLPDNAECSALDPNSPECCSGACFPVGNPPLLRCVS